MRQYNLGRWLGAYYTQLQYSASYMVFINLTMLSVTMWASARAQIVDLLPWLTFPLFLAIALVLLLVVLPLFDYVFMMKSRMSYQNEQSWRHNNPANEILARVEEKLDRIQKEIDELKS